MLKKLFKLYFSTIKNAPENIKKAIEIKEKEQYIIEQQYKRMKDEEKK